MTSYEPPTGDAGSLPADPFPGDPFAPQPKRPWYKRPILILAAAIVVIIAASAVVDIPHPATPETQATEYATLMRSLDTGIKTCTFGIHETLAIYARDVAGTLTPNEKAQIPGLVTQDAQACTFVNQSIINIATITVPPGPASKEIRAMITSSLQWTTSDAAAVISDLDILMTRPTDASTRKKLVAEEHRLGQDRAAAFTHVRAASRLLHGAYIPYPALPDIPITQ